MADLSISLGLSLQGAFSTNQLETHFASIKEATDRHGLILGSFGVDIASAERWIDYGCTFVPVSTNEQCLLGQGVAQLAGELGVPRT